MVGVLNNFWFLLLGLLIQDVFAVPLNDQSEGIKSAHQSDRQIPQGAEVSSGIVTVTNPEVQPQQSQAGDSGVGSFLSNVFKGVSDLPVVAINAVFKPQGVPGQVTITNDQQTSLQQQAELIQMLQKQVDEIKNQGPASAVFNDIPPFGDERVVPLQGPPQYPNSPSQYDIQTHQGLPQAQTQAQLQSILSQIQTTLLQLQPATQQLQAQQIQSHQLQSQQLNALSQQLQQLASRPVVLPQTQQQPQPQPQLQVAQIHPQSQPQVQPQLINQVSPLQQQQYYPQAQQVIGSASAQGGFPNQQFQHQLQQQNPHIQAYPSAAAVQSYNPQTPNHLQIQPQHHQQQQQQPSFQQQFNPQSVPQQSHQGVYPQSGGQVPQLLAQSNQPHYPVPPQNQPQPLLQNSLVAPAESPSKPTIGPLRPVSRVASTTTPKTTTKASTTVASTSTTEEAGGEDTDDEDDSRRRQLSS